MCIRDRWIICFLRIWQFGSAMVLFLAALKGVPADLYEAATIDGAGKWTQFFSITVPMITPIIFYNLVTQICQAFQEFNGPYIITNGGQMCIRDRYSVPGSRENRENTLVSQAS